MKRGATRMAIAPIATAAASGETSQAASRPNPVLVDHDLADVVLARRQRVEAEQQVAGPALLRARRELGRREQREQDEQAHRQAQPVRRREVLLTTIPQAGEGDRHERPDGDSGRDRLPHRPDSVTEEPEVRDRYDYRRQPRAREPRAACPPRAAKRATGVSSRLSSVARSRSPLTASAAASRASSAPTATATCESQVDRLALLEEVERLVGGCEIGHHAEQRAERAQERQPPPSEPEPAELLAGNGQPRGCSAATAQPCQAASVIDRNASLQPRALELERQRGDVRRRSDPQASANSARASTAPSTAIWTVIQPG